MNYFKFLCFFWAVIGIVSRIAMVVMGKKWNTWETEKAYAEKRPIWVYLVSTLGILLIIYTWYAVFTSKISYSWLIAILVSLTAIKVLMLLFGYRKFRGFVSRILRDPKKMLQLNVGVLIFSLILIIIGIFLY